ncbi:shikimate kinase [candidate division KSB1 bacterium]|nr:shikimate kinase [candidate division KSB1 bacterium]
MYPWDGKNIYFMGFMASGKTAIGKQFSSMMSWPFYDTDYLIEESAGKAISQIFADEGEAAFRKIETDIIRKVAAKTNQVIALGGGAVLREQNWKIIANSGISICLTAPVAVLANRIIQKSHRPLMANLSGRELHDKIENMLKERQPYYLKADYSFENGGELPVKEFALSIFKIIRDDI